MKSYGEITPLTNQVESNPNDLDTITCAGGLCPCHKRTEQEAVMSATRTFHTVRPLAFAGTVVFVALSLLLFVPMASRSAEAYGQTGYWTLAKKRW